MSASAPPMVLPSQYSTAAPNAVEVFSNAQNFSINGGTFNISLSHTAHQAARESEQPQHKPPAPTFLSTPPTSNPLTSTESELYARSLLPKRQGYPLWIPEPYEGSVSAHTAKGVMVGDVGVVNDDGGFQFLFNVCHAPDDPVNHKGVPDGFQPFPLEGLEVERHHSRFPPDSYVASSLTKLVENRRLLNCAPETNIRSTLTFTSARSEGAVIVLPTGAVRFDARNLAGLRQYAMRNAFEWYKYVNGRRGWEVPNGALYLITGCDKCTCWAAVSFCEHVVDGNNLCLELLKVTEHEEKQDGAGEKVCPRVHESSVRYVWKGRSIVANRTGPGDEVPLAGYGNSIPARPQNYCVFLRGYKIAINPDRAEDGIILSSLVDSSPDIILSKGTHIPFGLDTGGFSGVDVGSSSVTDFEEAAISRRQEASPPKVSVPRTSRRQQPYHPSDVVNRFMLSKNAKVAITHDDEWCSVLDPEASNMPDEDDLLRRVLSTHKVANGPDGAFLQPLNLADPLSTFSVRKPLSLSSPRLFSPSRYPDLKAVTTKDVSSITQEVGIPSHKPEPGVMAIASKQRADLWRLNEDIVFKPGEWTDMDLLDENRSLIHTGKLFRQPGDVLERRTLYVLLFDNYLVMTKVAWQWDGVGKYYVDRRPIPIDLLTLVNFTDPPTPRGGNLLRSLRGERHNTDGSDPSNPSLTSSTPKSPQSALITASPSERNDSGTDTSYPDSRLVYPCTIHHNGRMGGTYILYAESAAVRVEWKEKLDKAVGLRKIVQESNKVFKVETLSADTFVVPSPSIGGGGKGDGGGGGGAWVSFTGKVTCLVPFNTPDGKNLLAIGCAEGVWIGFRHDSHSMRRVLHLKMVTQCAMLEEFGIFLVLANKSLFAYHIESLVSSPSSMHSSQTPQNLSGNKDVQFFSVGSLHNRTLVIYMRKKGLDSMFHVVEPVIDKINERSEGPAGLSRFGFRPPKSDWFRDYRDFLLPYESYDLIFLEARIAILCAEGFEILDLMDLQSVTIPQREDPSYALLAKRWMTCRPLGMFRSTDEEFLLCYTEFGLYVNKYGDPSRETGSIEWEGTAERVALRPPYILLFDTRFIEVRHVQTGRLAQIIPGHDVRCLWDGRGASLPPVLTSGSDDSDERMIQEARVYGVMNARDTVSQRGVVNRQGGVAQHVFELIPLYLPGSLASPSTATYFPAALEEQRPGAQWQGDDLVDFHLRVARTQNQRKGKNRGPRAQR